MSDDRMFERNARSWLELGPTNAPDRVIAGALLAIETTRQDRPLWQPWKDLRMTTSARLIAVALIGTLAIAGGLLFAGSRNAPVIAPTPSPTTAFAEVPTGWIVFETLQGRFLSDNYPSPNQIQIWLVHPDGSGLHELSPGLPLAGKGSFDISPDGRTVAFTGGTVSQIYTVSMDGGTPVLLSTDCAALDAGSGPPPCLDSDPAYAPDGKHLAFIRNGQLSVRDLSSGAVTTVGGGGGRVVVNGEGEFGASKPAFSPDGRQIAFRMQFRWYSDPSKRNRSSIGIVNADGTGSAFELPSAATQDSGDPDWSPDGRVLYSTAVDSFGSPAPFIESGIFTSRPDGTQVATICTMATCLKGGLLPSYTSDGTHILFWADSQPWPDSQSWVDGHWALMNADGTGARFVSGPDLLKVNIPAAGMLSRFVVVP